MKRDQVIEKLQHIGEHFQLQYPLYDEDVFFSGLVEDISFCGYFSVDDDDVLRVDRRCGQYRSYLRKFLPVSEIEQIEFDEKNKTIKIVASETFVFFMNENEELEFQHGQNQRFDKMYDKLCDRVTVKEINDFCVMHVYKYYASRLNIRTSLSSMYYYDDAYIIEMNAAEWYYLFLFVNELADNSSHGYEIAENFWNTFWFAEIKDCDKEYDISLAIMKVLMKKVGYYDRFLQDEAEQESLFGDHWEEIIEDLQTIDEKAVLEDFKASANR